MNRKVKYGEGETLLKILGGQFKGARIITPKGSQTRPTAVMLKRKLFDSFQDFSDYHFLELCAGSGSIGLEAMSRGAKSCKLVETSQNALKALYENVESISKKYDARATVVRKDVTKFLKAYEANEIEKTFVYIDPPYENLSLYKQIMSLLMDRSFSGIIAIESCELKSFKISEFEKMFGEFDKIFSHGSRYIGLYYWEKK